MKIHWRVSKERHDMIWLKILEGSLYALKCLEVLALWAWGNESTSLSLVVSLFVKCVNNKTFVRIMWGVQVEHLELCPAHENMSLGGCRSPFWQGSLWPSAAGTQQALKAVWLAGSAFWWEPSWRWPRSGGPGYLHVSRGEYEHLINGIQNRVTALRQTCWDFLWKILWSPRTSVTLNVLTNNRLEGKFRLSISVSSYSS